MARGLRPRLPYGAADWTSTSRVSWLFWPRPHQELVPDGISALEGPGQRQGWQQKGGWGKGNGVGKGGNENGRISHTQTPEIEKFDRIRAAVNDKRGATASGFGNGGGPPSPPHNVFVGSGGVGMESNDDDGGDGDRIRSVCNGLAGRGAQFGAPFLVISVQ